MGILNINLKNPFKAHQPTTGNAPQTPAPSPANTSIPPNTPAPAHTGGTSQPANNPPPAQKQPELQRITKGNVTLVTHSPEEALIQVQEERDKVAFGRSRVQGIMSNFNQLWALIGPLLFAAGTIGEIFLVLWDRQINKEPFAGFVIVIVSMIAEGGLLAVSFSAKLLRNQADKRPTGWTRREEKKLSDIKNIWWFLSLGVAATQIAFVMSQTRSDDIGGFWGLAAIATVRAAVAMVADYYTAYISEEKASSADEALEEQSQRTEFTEKMLDRKAVEVDALNRGAIKVQEAAQKASINQERVDLQAETEKDTMATEQELKQLENANRIAQMKAKYQEAAAWSDLQLAATRAMQARITKMTVEMVEGDGPIKQVNSTLHYLIREVKELKALKQLPSGQQVSTEPLQPIMEEDD